MLLVGLAAIAMSRPFLVTQSTALNTQIKGDAVIIIDNSYFTMAKAEEGLFSTLRGASPLRL